MAQINQIGLSIYGGAQGMELDQFPLVSAGEVPENFHAFSPVLVTENRSWMMVHALSYTLYCLYSKAVHLSDGRPGQVLFCLFMPDRKRLSDGKSPLGVLDSVWDTFKLYGLRDETLPDAPIGAAPFAKILEQCRLEDRQVQLPVMTGSAPASFCAENINQADALMRYSRYELLATVGRLEIGLNCKTTLALPVKGQGVRKPEPLKASVQKPSVSPSSSEKKAKSPTVIPLPAEEKGHASSRKKVWTLWASVLVLGAAVGIAYHLYEGKKEGDEPIAAMDKEELAVTESKVPDSALFVREPVEADTVAVVERAEALPEPSPKSKAVAAVPEERVSRPSAPAVPEWQAKVRQAAKSCPHRIRLGVDLTAIVYTTTSVTCTLVYQEMSKYNITEYAKEQMQSDEKSVREECLQGLPADVRVDFIKKDRNGRVM